MLRELTYQDGDAEESSEATQVAEAVLVGCGAQSIDVGLEIKRWPVDVPDAHGCGSDPERMDRPRGDGGRLARGQFAPLAPDEDVQRSLDHLVLLGQARVHMRLGRPAVRGQVPLHL